VTALSHRKVGDARLGSIAYIASYSLPYFPFVCTNCFLFLEKQTQGVRFFLARVIQNMTYNSFDIQLLYKQARYDAERDLFSPQTH